MKLDWLWRNWNSEARLWDGMPYRKRKKDSSIQTNNLMAEGNQYGYDEIVDTVTDLVKAEVKAYAVFKGKFDAGKAITWAIGEYPTIKEAVQDWPVFEQQVTDLFAEEGIQALDAISRNLSDSEKAQSRIYKLAVFGAVGYKNTLTVVELGKQMLELGGNIFAKN